ncbi:hypothetical protein JM79_0392 [Gramella sp. Hel_I_59]|uniref:tryptophan-rich sensory protein n=1 Tax=Gramella sp. Hel_I_59 TaxID=1249978 RepID=UPI001150A01E|nr:tryptophan-rich sensory protein [Gramella sp. Hel_I_59]TQI69512.1 hypothetical protein JM79_0392 [Gramella sp. Hel_I_59]
MIKKLAVANFISVIITIAFTYYTQTGEINGKTIGEMSDKYSNLFTPAGYAFSIWGVIFLSLLAFSVYMLIQAFGNGKHTKFIKRTKFWFIVANIGTCLWSLAWLYDFPGLSVVIMFLILAKLCKIIINTEMELTDPPFKIIAFYWWPICLYSGWIAVAAIANTAAWLKETGWDGAFLSEVQWTLLMILITVALNITMIYKRNMREFAAVGVWALIAIYVKQIGQYDVIAYSAAAGALLIFLNISYHGFKNRKKQPLYRMMKGEKA